MVSAAGQKPLLETDVYTWEKGEVNEAYRQAYRQTDRRTDRQICRETVRQTSIQRDRQTDRKTGGQTNIYRTHGQYYLLN